MKSPLAGLGTLVVGLAILACTPRPSGPVVVTDSLIAPGESLYIHGSYDSAEVLWRSALRRPGVQGSATEARLFSWLGLIAYRRGEYAEARQVGERALGLKRRLNMSRVEVAESQNALGLVAWNEGRLHDAMRLFEDALPAFDEAGDRWGVAKVSNNLALVALEFGRFAEARAGFETGRAAAKEIGNARVEGRATANLAMIEIWTGDPGVAVDLLDEALRLADEADDPVGSEAALGQLAVAWSVQGELGRALAVLDSAMDIARRQGLRQEEANDLAVAASIHYAAGDADGAIELYAQARALNEAMGLVIEAGTVLRHEAAMRADRGALEQARSDARRALTLHREAGATLEGFQDMLTLAQIELEAGDQAATARWLGEARTAGAEVESPQTRVALAVAAARAADRRNEPRTVLSTLVRTEGDLESAGTGATIEVEWLRTRAFAAMGQLDSAVAAGRRAVAAIERTAGSLGSRLLRSSAITERSQVFADLVLVLLRLDQTEEAFLVADAARGRALLDHLASARDRARGEATERDLAERQRLLRSIDALLERLEEVQTRPRSERGPDDEGASRELAERLRRARAEYEAVLIRLAERDPARASVLGTRGISMAAIRAALRPDEVLVEYLITSDRVLAFAATRAGVRAVAIPIPMVELENRVRVARGLLSSPRHGDAGHAVTEELYRLLIRPLGKLGGPGEAEARRMLIVPHGILSYLPFAALRNPSSGRYLIEERTLQYLPTAAALPTLRTRPAGPLDLAGGSVFAPLPDLLPATVIEADVIRGLMPGSRRVIGRSATEAALRGALAEPRVVHVATHGVMNPANPMFSRLQLARGSGRTHEDDGRLEVHELLGMRVASPIVFLSGCETAMGAAHRTAFDRGRDYATLSQAFLYAGASGVVATLWRIDDEGAAALAERFYRRAGDLPPAVALAAAQRELLGGARWAHPYYWAGYTLAGAGLSGVGEKPVAVSVSR